ncbi:MAG: type IV pilin protein [Elusimicrobia bacterium]|nr:type IV pilin protein [Elusimicrobiota bacterium]
MEQTRTVEVLTSLRALAQAEEYYFLNKGHYTSTMTSLAVSPPDAKYYDISVSDTPTYNITAVRKGIGMDGDVPHFQYFMQNPTTEYMGMILCLVPKGNDNAISICEHLGGIVVPGYSDATYDAYTLNLKSE